MESPVEGRPGRLRSPLALPEGVEAGLIGALAVAAVFFVRDAQLERTHLWFGGLVGILAMGGFLAWRHLGAVRIEAGEG